MIDHPRSVRRRAGGEEDPGRAAPLEGAALRLRQDLPQPHQRERTPRPTQIYFETTHPLIRTVLNVVLPDDELPAEAHPFEWLASLAARRGLNVTADELRAVPYDVILTADVEALHR